LIPLVVFVFFVFLLVVFFLLARKIFQVAVLVLLVFVCRDYYLE